MISKIVIKFYVFTTFLDLVSDGLDSEFFLDELRFKALVSTSSSSNFGLLMDLDELRRCCDKGVTAGVLVDDELPPGMRDYTSMKLKNFVEKFFSFFF